MSNFIEEFLKGKKGKNKGLPLGPGLTAVSRAINGNTERNALYVAKFRQNLENQPS